VAVRPRASILANSNARSLVPINVARIAFVLPNPAGAGSCLGFVAFLLAIGCTNLQNATAEGDTRTISFHHIHTDEDLTITYKVNGRYDEEALKKINYELRDWRKNETIEMDPHLIDLVWDVHRDVGSKEPIQVVCGYRSPATNAMLRARSSGVAKFSQHTLGKAMDFYMPDVPLEHIRAVGLFLERGGVGFYPTSGSPFVHLDTGNVRHWPAIASQDMPRLMAQGQNLHAAAEHVAVAQASPAPVKPVIATAKPSTAAAGFEMASVDSKPVQLRPSQATSLVAQAAMPAQVSASDIISQHDDRHGTQDTAAAAPPPSTANPPATGTKPFVRRPAAVASADDATASLAPWPLPDRGKAQTGMLAYADPNAPVQTPRASPMGVATARPVAPPDTTIALKRSGDHPSVIAQPPAPPAPGPGSAKVGDRSDDPWLTALMTSPSLQNFMSTSTVGSIDYRNLAPLLQKPTTSVMMTFTTDQHTEMSATRFSGAAVVFVSTVTFNTRTASLR
jgi:uncharacterized protein YcbK (DUF882 family)